MPILKEAREPKLCKVWVVESRSRSCVRLCRAEPVTKAGLSLLHSGRSLAAEVA